MSRSILVFTTAIGLIVCSTGSARATSPLDGLVDYVRESLAKGSDTRAREVIEALESNPQPLSIRDAVVESLSEVLSAHQRQDLLERVRALPVLSENRTPQAVRPLRFPRDHGNHTRSFSEWWYFNGHLQIGGRPFGYELSFFRVAFRVCFVHVALTDLSSGEHPFSRRYLRRRSCRLEEGRMGLVYGSEQAEMTESGEIKTRFNVDGDHLELVLTPERPPMLVNGNGLIDMAEGTSSRYYSHTRLKTRGTLQRKDGSILTVEGRSWFDHQWGNFIILFRPYEWFCFQMDDGSDYNLWETRKWLGFSTTALINKLMPEGDLSLSEKLHLERTAWWQSPRTHDYYVTGWNLSLPEFGEFIRVTTDVQDQEMPRVGWLDVPPGYWEGAVKVLRENADGTTTRGVGYMEHMPYTRPTKL